LARLNPNLGSASTSASARRGLTSTVPKPVATPDVFSITPVTDKPSKSNKRQLESGATGSSKKARQDLKAEEEAWRAKWIKGFPALTFHFELGTESKAMEQRVKLLGAVSHGSSIYCLWRRGFRRERVR
jgi:hypothetical protein